MISIKKVSKKYGEKTGNFDINIELKKGEILGVIGPNGAGKTTLIRQILGFIKPDEGEIKINDLDPWTQRENLMSFTGYVAGEIALYENLTGMEFLKTNYALKKMEDFEFTQKLIDFFEIDTKVKIKKMSKGMKQKIAIIAAVMNKPEFLVLDEPTSGLDPVMQEQFAELIAKLKKDYQITVIVCSHILEEITKLTDKIIFIKEGSIIENIATKSITLEQLNAKFKESFNIKKGLD